MKYLLIKIPTLVFCFFSMNLFGQAVLKFDRKSNSNSDELIRYIAKYENYKKADVKIKLKSLEGKKVYLAATEYENGKQKNYFRLSNLNESQKNRLNLNITIFCKVTSDSLIKMVCSPIANRYLSFTISKTTSAEYAFKVITNESQLKVRTDPNIYPIISFVLPYEDPKYPGYKFYCEIQGMEIPVENWGSELGIEHYWIFSIEIE